MSILIPVYNASAYVAETLEKALIQTWPNLEIIVVDDGSTDDSLAIARRYEGDRVKVVSQQNRGASSARNHAFRLSKGEYIQYLDADDWMEPNKIEAQMEALLKAEPGTVAFCNWTSFPAGKLRGFSPELSALTDPIELLTQLWLRGEMILPHCYLVPRPIIEAAGPWDESLSLNDDGEFFCRVLVAAAGLKFVENTQTHYYLENPDSLSKTVSRQAAASHLHSIQMNVQHMLAMQHHRDLRKSLACSFATFIQHFYPKYPDLRITAVGEIRKLGFRRIPLTGGWRFRLIARLVGWENALRLRRALQKRG